MLIALWTMRGSLTGAPPRAVPYSELLSDVQAGKVQEAALDPTHVVAVLHGEGGQKGETFVADRIPNLDERGLLDEMVKHFGMSEALGVLTWGRTDSLRFLPGSDSYERDYSEETARAIDAEVRRLVEESHARAMAILRDRPAELEAIGRELLVRETLDRAELESLAAPRSERRQIAAVATAG